MRVLRLAIPSSPSKSVVLSAIYREILAGGVPEEVYVISDSGDETYKAVRRVFSGLSWAGTDVVLREVTGVGEWFRALEGLNIDVVDVTPGRKVHALALYTQAISGGARVRYSYLVDEHRFGYMYPGYAPPQAVKLLEVHPELRELGYRIPGELAEGSWEGDAPVPVLHSLINTARVVGSELRVSSRDLRLRIDTSSEPFGVIEASGPYAGTCLDYASFPPNIWEVVEEVRRCVREGCAIALDTNAFMAGLSEFLNRYLRGYGSLVTHLEPVMAEIMAFIEMKHSPNGLLRELAYLDAMVAGHAITPKAARRSRPGDVEIIKALSEVAAASRCTCFITADRNLATAVKARETADVILLRQPRGPHLIEESLPKLVRCVALAGRAQVSVGGASIRLSDGEVRGKDVVAHAVLGRLGGIAELVSALYGASRG